MEATSSKLGRRSVIRLVCTDNLYAIIEGKSKETSTVRFHRPASSVKMSIAEEVAALLRTGEGW
jgi:hypothetical protein